MTILDETPDNGATADAGRASRFQDSEAYAAAPPDGAAGGEPENPSRPAPTRAKDWVLTHIVAVVVGLILVTLAAALIVTTLQLRHRNAVDSARTSALAAAKTYAVELASYNYKDLNQDFGKVMADSTPSFRQSFSQSSSALKSVLTKYDATAKATVVAAGVVSATTGRAQVLLFLNQTVTNSTQKTSPTQSRVEITLVRSGGRWLINDVSLL